MQHVLTFITFLVAGNFGKVREAIDTRTMTRVAIKTLNLKRLRKMRSGEV